MSMSRLLLGFLFFIILTSCGVKKTKEDVVKTPSKLDHPYIEKFHEAVRLKQRGQLNDAIKAFENCLTMRPNDDAVYFALSQLYLQANQKGKSVESIQKASKLDPKNHWYTQELAYMYFELKNYKEATNQFKILVQKEPRNVEWLFSYAESLMRSGDTQGAIKALDKLQDQTGINPELSTEKFRLYRSVKQDEKAINELVQALKVFPQDAQLLANMVDYYFEKKQSEKAFDYLKKLAEVDPQNGNAHLALAQYYDQKGDRAKSYEELGLAFQCDDIEIDQKVKILLSLFDNQVKLDKEMFVLCEILLNKHPEEAKIYTVYGDCLLKNKQSEEALKSFKKAIEYDKTRYVVWEQVMFMEYDAQDYNALFKTASYCLEYFTVQNKPYLFKSIAGNQLKKYNEVIESAEIGAELTVNDPQIKAEFFAQKGEAHFGLKQFSEGKQSYENALKLTPNSALIKNNYAYRLALAKIDLDRAGNLIQEVLKNNPTESHFIDTYGWILFQQGKYSEAKVQIKNAYDLKPKDKVIVEHMGDVLFKEGNISEALKFWQEAKLLGSKNTVLDKKIEDKNYYEPIY
jgi:tetratricopeptide (TPR) repeat protein